MKYLVTGAAGFIGSHVCKRLISLNHEVTGIDNLNDYYDVNLKYGRLGSLTGTDVLQPGEAAVPHPNFRFIKADIKDKQSLLEIVAEGQFDIVCHLAAQAGVRYSLENPDTYLENNITGFFHVLEACRKHPVAHLVYASSSSVYGLNEKVPFSERDNTDHPVSLYAATKKSNELMAHTYSHLYGLPATGLRFFTVYGPWGRPDMSPFLFIDSILKGKPIRVFNNGDMLRDFTYIDDIVEGIIRIMDNPPKAGQASAPHKIYNIGNSSPVRLMDYIRTIEETIGVEAQKEFLPMQPGDVYQTNADTSSLEEATGFRPNTSLKDGVRKTVEWFREYYLQRKISCTEGEEQ